ncbi:hypothetical protein like AT1G10140 [Hibiscus trionum]|uniref:Uncharacterized protein n=1 Tax=Hibiscus trionum TaxID=183268 RepID=A0A9W7I707_HIBTR|nr:hypothetical protein like AT1G10140 [Hibiscus trionum]
MRSKGQSHNKFMRFITVPLKALGKARDLYVRSLTRCTSSVSYAHASGLPRSFSVSSATSNDSDDLRELIRAASVRSLGHRNEVEMLFQQQRQSRVQTRSNGLPKSCSVAMGRIDEENPCEFEENEAVVVVDKKRDLLYPRSKSYAVPKTSPSFDSY